jgi:hypothetical protein
MKQVSEDGKKRDVWKPVSRHIFNPPTLANDSKSAAALGTEIYRQIRESDLPTAARQMRSHGADPGVLERVSAALRFRMNFNIQPSTSPTGSKLCRDPLITFCTQVLNMSNRNVCPICAGNMIGKRPVDLIVIGQRRPAIL